MNAPVRPVIERQRVAANSAKKRNRSDCMRRRRILSLLRIREADGYAEVWLGACIEGNLGLRVRASQARRAVNALLRSKAHVSWPNGGEARIALELADPLVYQILDQIVDQLTLIANRPLIPSELLVALPISNKERLKWTKAGRLPKSGSLEVGRHHMLRVPTYCVSGIERIERNPVVIETWRQSASVNS